jgi:hypothetical protein
MQECVLYLVSQCQNRFVLSEINVRDAAEPEHERDPCARDRLAAPDRAHSYVADAEPSCTERIQQLSPAVLLGGFDGEQAAPM